MQVLAAEGDFAWSFNVEVLAAGPAALARRAAIMGLFAELWRGLHERARRQDPVGGPPEPQAALRFPPAVCEVGVRTRSPPARLQR